MTDNTPPTASRDLCARIFHAVHEADRTAIKSEDAQSGFVSFYTLPTGPWHKIIALVRELPVSEADLLPYLMPPPDVPRRLGDEMRQARAGGEGEVRKLIEACEQIDRRYFLLKEHPTHDDITRMKIALDDARAALARPEAGEET